MRNISRRVSAVAALAVSAILLVASSGRPEVEPATLVLRHGRIATVDDAKRRRRRWPRAATRSSPWAPTRMSRPTSAPGPG